MGINGINLVGCDKWMHYRLMTCFWKLSHLVARRSEVIVGVGCEVARQVAFWVDILPT